MSTSTTPEHDKKRLFACLAPAATILGLCVVFYAPALATGKTFFAFDCLNHYPPWQSKERANNTLITDPINLMHLQADRFHRSMQAGTPSRWDWNNYCGRPLGSGQKGLHRQVLFGLLPPTVAHDVLLFVYTLLAGVFLWLYLRQVGADPWASVVGSVAWMFNGYCMVWLEFENVPGMAVSLPAMLWSIELWRSKRNAVAFWGMVAACSFSIFAAYAHLMAFQFLLAGVYALVRCFPLLPRKAAGEPEAGKKKQSKRKRRVRSSGGRQAWLGAALPLAGVLLALLLSFWFNAGTIRGMMGTAKPSTVAKKKGGDTIANARSKQRKGMEFSVLLERTGQLHPEYLATAFFPGFYGGPTRGIAYPPKKGFQPYNNNNELCMYAGILAILLAWAALVYPRSSPISVFFLVAAPVILAMAMGTILLKPVVDWVPGLNMSTPTRILYLYGFCMAVLSGLGASALMKRPERKHRLPLLLSGWGVLLALGFGIAVWAQSEPNQMKAAKVLVDQYGWDKIGERVSANMVLWSDTFVPHLMMLVLSVACLVAFALLSTAQHRLICVVSAGTLLAVDLIGFGWRYNTTTDRSAAYPLTPGLEWLKEQQTEPFRTAMPRNFLHNSMSPFDIEDIGGYASFYDARYGKIAQLMQGQDPRKGEPSRWLDFHRFGSALQDFANMRFILLPPGVQFQSPKFEKKYDRELQIFENQSVLPRAFLVEECVVAESGDQALVQVAGMTTADFASKVVLEGALPSGFPRSDVRLEVPSEVAELAYAGETVTARLSTPVDAFLVMSDTFHPRWHAVLNGKETTILRANYAFRAIPIPAGQHELVLQYGEPRGSYWGWTLKKHWKLLVFILCLLATLAWPRYASFNTDRETKAASKATA